MAPYSNLKCRGRVRARSCSANNPCLVGKLPKAKGEAQPFRLVENLPVNFTCITTYSENFNAQTSRKMCRRMDGRQEGSFEFVYLMIQ